MTICERRNRIPKVLRSIYKRALVAFLLIPAARSQSSDPNRFLTVKKWTGTFTVSTAYSGEALLSSWKVAQQSTGTIQFTPEPNVPGSWIGTVTAGISWNDDVLIGTADPPCTLSWSHHASFTQTSVGHLRVAGGTFATFADPSEIAAVVPTITTGPCPPPAPQGDVMQWYLESNFPLPATGMRVQGSQTSPPTFFWPLPVPPPSNATVVTWDFTADAPDLEVVVSAAGYDSWRPQAGANEKTAGNTIAFTGKLQYKDGSTPAVGAKRFTYELTNRSSVPGIAMNYPPKSMALTDPDLQLDPANNPKLTVMGDFGQNAVTQDGTYITSPPVTISSYDWGAYGTVKITAEMPDGTKIVGHLQGDDAQTEVRIPQRSAESAIADKWKSDTGMTGKSDLDDSETTQGGDGHPGDGLSLYEEYRGFYENGKRIEGDPTKKELFVNDRSGANYGSAKLYEKLTDIRVHSHLLTTEMSDTDVAVINFNYNPDRHLVDQHGLVIYNDPELSGYAITHRRPGFDVGTPKTVYSIALPTDLLWQGSPLFPGPTVSYAAAAVTVVHEMLHASNVAHHGEDREHLDWTDPLPGGLNAVQVTENGSSTVTVRLESPAGDSRAPILKNQTGWAVGIIGGTNSGDQDCPMRYNDASVYDFRFYNDGDNRLIVYPPQPVAPANPMLCRSSNGTGINDPLRLRRFGDAKCGNCYSQFCINDRFDHAAVCP